jgi:hypothetical protein
MGAFKTQPRRARVFLGVLLAPITGVLILVCLARKQLSGTTSASDENRSHDMHSLTLFSKATEAEKSVEYWKNTGMERLRKQVPLIARMYIARDQRFIWLYTPLLLLIPIFAIGCDEFEQ